jgi:hypothetical protein
MFYPLINIIITKYSIEQNNEKLFTWEIVLKESLPNMEKRSIKNDKNDNNDTLLLK